MTSFKVPKYDKSGGGMKSNFLVVRIFWNCVEFEVLFDRYGIQFDDGNWKAIIQIQNIGDKSIFSFKSIFKEIIIEAHKVDSFGTIGEFALKYLNSES